MDNKIIGYILSGIGLVLVILSSTKGQEFVPIPFASGAMILGIGALFIIAGIFLMTNFGTKKKKREVPIYDGKGKKRKIVGYQTEEK